VQSLSGCPGRASSQEEEAIGWRVDGTLPRYDIELLLLLPFQNILLVQKLFYKT